MGERPGGDVPAVFTPPPHHPRFPLSDGVRGVASIAIVLVHVSIFAGGVGSTLLDRALIRLDTAITLFFLLSAFLLYRPMIAHRTGGPAAPGVVGYGWRRFLRIYPAYWVALVGLGIFPGLAGVFSGEWPLYFSLASNFDPDYDSAECITQQFRCGLPQTWSLTAEVTFYAVLPLYAALTALIARGRSTGVWVRRELLLLALLALASVLLSLPPLDLRHEPWFRFSFLGNMLWIGLGLALAIASVALQGRRLPRSLRIAADNPALPWGLAAALWLALVPALPATPFIVARDTAAEFAAIHVLFGAISVLVLLPVVFGDPNRGLGRRLLGSRPVIWLGMISYGTFLWHVTFAYDLGFGGAQEGFWTVLVGTLLLAIPCAAASYYLVERPLMRLKYRRPRDLLGRRQAREPGGA